MGFILVFISKDGQTPSSVETAAHPGRDMSGYREEVQTTEEWEETLPLSA